MATPLTVGPGSEMAYCTSGGFSLVMSFQPSGFCFFDRPCITCWKERFYGQSNPSFFDSGLILSFYLGIVERLIALMHVYV